MARGGARAGAGRPIGQGRFGEKTKTVRLPASMIEAVYQFIAKEDSEFNLPFYSSTVAAGFPSPADDHIDTKLDLNQYLIKHPAATFFVRAKGESMLHAGIHDNDILIVDRSLEPTNGKIVIVAIDGQLTVKRLKKTTAGKIYLMPENPDFSPIELKKENNIHIWGVVTNVIHAV